MNINNLTKYREQILYIIFGFLTTVISVAFYALFTEIITLDVLVANIISWVVSVLFAFVTNRYWVFGAQKGSFLKQLFGFYIGRILTLIVEEIVLWIFITQLQFNGLTIKIIAQFLIIVLNYLISKFLIFKRIKNNP